MKLRLHILLIAVMIVLLPGVAGAKSQNVILDNIPNKQRGDTVQISGNTSFDEIIIKVIGPDNTVLLFEIAEVLDGEFNAAFTIPTNAIAGQYKIAAGKGTDVANASFLLIDQTSSVDFPTGTVPEKPQAGQCIIGEDIIVQAERFKQALEKCQQSNLVLELSDEALLGEIIIPLSALASKQLQQLDLIITIKTPTFSVDLPIALASLISDDGTIPSDASIVFNRKPVDRAVMGAIDKKANAEGLSLISQVAQFGILIETKGGRIELNQFGHRYVNRALIVDDEIDASGATVLMYDPKSGVFSFVPAVFTVEDGKTTITMKHNANGIYTVVSFQKSFADIDGHWGRQAIELLASKRIINGVSQSKFNPDGEITRAEFAALLVRSLGLNEESSPLSFVDVGPDEWFTGVIGAAVSSGLINGYKDGTFRPDALISREQMVTMISRALEFIGKPKPNADPHSLLLFKDGSEISSWAASSVAEALHIGLIKGMGDGNFAPAGDASRSQAATMLLRMLEYVEFIN